MCTFSRPSLYSGTGIITVRTEREHVCTLFVCAVISPPSHYLHVSWKDLKEFCLHIRCIQAESKFQEGALLPYSLFQSRYLHNRLSVLYLWCFKKNTLTEFSERYLMAYVWADMESGCISFPCSCIHVLPHLHLFLASLTLFTFFFFLFCSLFCFFQAFLLSVSLLFFGGVICVFVGIPVSCTLKLLRPGSTL